MIAAVVLAALFNVFFSDQLPLIESGILVLHLGGFIAISAVSWTMSPLADVNDVFTSSDNPGWNSFGTSCMVRILAPILTMLGADSVGKSICSIT